MHKDFSEWYRSAGMEQTAEVLQKRWAGIEAVEIDRNSVVYLTELFFGFTVEETFLAAFRKAFQDADSSFRMRNNNRELSLLAGAKLISSIDELSSDWGDFVALALVSCAAQNLRAAPCVVEIPELAAEDIADRTIDRVELEADESAEDDETQRELQKMRLGLDIVTEESNILWWVFGETSRDTNQRWSECKPTEASLIAGKELADLTRIIPGPSAAGALLDRVVKASKGKSSTQILVKDAIAATPLDWRQEFAKNRCPATMKNLRPISQGIKMSVDLADGDTWMAAVAHSTNIRSGKISPSLLAYQIYIESLLLKQWSNLK